MGLLDYYRQFEERDPEEVNRELRERRHRERALALEQLPELDLSHTEWPELPHSEIVNAAIAVARGHVNRYPDRHARRMRELLAERHGVQPEQVVVGNGATELLQAAARTLLSAGDELVTGWPSYPLYPLVASRAGARPVAVPLAGGRVDPEALLDAVGPRTRVVVVCNPNDPTGTLLPAERIDELLERLPEDVHLILDEAYAELKDAEDVDAALRLVERHPRLLVLRTFSKAWGLAALRCGYAVGSLEAGRLLEAISPALGVGALTQAAVEHALAHDDPGLARRRALVIEQRRALASALHELPYDAPETQTGFVWLRASGMSGAQLAARLESERIRVAPGGPLGDDEHVRVSLVGRAATARLIDALGRIAA